MSAATARFQAEAATDSISSFTRVRSSGLLQRKCACGGTLGPSGEYEGCSKKRKNALQRAMNSSAVTSPRFAHDFSCTAATAPRSLAVNQPGDSFEQEADCMAEAAMADRSSSVRASSAGLRLQRDEAPTGPATSKEPSEDEKYKTAAKKTAEAFLETEAGKQLKTKAEELDKDFVSSVEGKVIADTALGGALAAIIATNKELPVPIPEIPLDFIAPGLKAKLTWEGPVRSPTNVSLKLTTGRGVSVAAGYSRTGETAGRESWFDAHHPVRR
jgi:hypothetical protein